MARYRPELFISALKSGMNYSVSGSRGINTQKQTGYATGGKELNPKEIKSTIYC